MKIKKIITMLLVLSLSFGTLTSNSNITQAKKRVKLSKKKLTVEVSTDYVKTLTLKNAKSKVKWSTSNKKIAVIDSKYGKYKRKADIRGKKAGRATITAKCKGKKYKCKVIVKEKEEEDDDTYYEDPIIAYQVDITNNLGVDSAYDKISITIKNTGQYNIYLGNYSDLDRRYMTVYNALAGSIVHQSSETGYCLIPETTLEPNKSTTFTFTRLYVYQGATTFWKTFHLCSASYFEIPIYDHNKTLHTEKCYVK